VSQARSGRSRRKGGRRRRAQTIVVQTNGNQRRRGPGRKKRRPRQQRRGRGVGAGSHLYLKSLLEPEHFTARIPDTNSWESAVFQQITDLTLTTAADGSAAMTISPVPITPTSANFSAVTIGLGTNAAGFYSTQTTIAPANSAAIVSAFDLFRVVSGSLTVEFIGTTSSDAGQLCVYPLFRGQVASNNIASALGQSFNLAVPLRNGARMLWKPMDNADTEYEEAQTANVYGLYNGSSSTAAPKNTGSGSASSDVNPPTALSVAISGAAASTVVARVRAVFNYEAIPTNDSFQLFQTANEPNQPTIMSQAVNMVGQMPWADVWTGVSGLASSMMSQAMESQIAPAIGGLISGGAMRYLRPGPRGRLSIMDDLD